MAPTESYGFGHGVLEYVFCIQSNVEVRTISSHDCVVTKRSFTVGNPILSDDAQKRVPMTTPSQPRAITAAIVVPSTIPPAANIGTVSRFTFAFVAVGSI